MSKSIRLLAAFALLVACVIATAKVHGDNSKEVSTKAEQLFADGNYREALSEYSRLLEDNRPAYDVHQEAISRVRRCYQKLNQVHQMDDFLAKMTKRFGNNWQVLPAVAQSYLAIPHYGYQISGEFHRGNHRGGGKAINTQDRDRANALKLFWQAYLNANTTLQGQGDADQKTKQQVAKILVQMSEAILHHRNHHQAWRLQSKTDLQELPDREAAWQQHGQTKGAAVDSDDSPVLYEKPASWDEATNDGERWRWLLEEAVRWNPQLKSRMLQRRADFLRSQFGVQTLADYGWFFGRHAARDSDQQEGIFALPTLKENETVARLATGIRRFELPDEHNHIKLYQAIVEPEPAEKASLQWRQSVEQLATLFENRKQYPRAAYYWRMLLKHVPNREKAKRQLEQIVGNWGQFESVLSQPAGQGATVDFSYRNGKRVEFTAHAVDVQLLLADVKDYLKSDPSKIDWQKLQIENLGYRLINQREDKYLGEEVARWSLDLEPREKHFDRRITVTTPLQKAGAYLLTSKMEDGNTTSIVIWLNDTAIVKKPLGKGSLYYVADSNTGKRIPKCNIEFFGYWQKHLDGNRYKITTINRVELTDEYGLVQFKADDASRSHHWLAIATTPAGRLAYLGFRSIWAGDYYQQKYQQVKVFTVTDRPVYRPDQQLKFKFWVRQATYDSDGEAQSKYAAQSFQIEIRDPKNEKVFTTQLISDAYGGLAGEWEIPTGATLGQYRINVVNHGGGTFRVEQYKKPEFEVTIEAPDQPVELGKKITAKVSAKYYFGSPVTSGTVKYKVLRTNYHQAWYPPMPWDWLYGPGYGWFSQEYSWYPGWARWGCFGPSPWWFWQAPTPPEVIVEREVALGEDGTIEIEIDTAVAKLLHPDQDHSYQIQAEVVDQSRRTIVGNGRVLVGREPFKVQLWLDRGYYRAGDTITVGAAARTLDGKPVVGNGKLRLLKVNYEDSQPVETEVGTWELSTGEAGQAELQIKASEPGQYRLSYELADDQQHTIEGGQMLTIAGEGFNGADFRFNDLELIPEQREYQTGEKVALQINTNRTGAAVLLFARPSNGIYQPPKLVPLDGKSTIVELDVTAADMPNFFVEAVTVHGGKSHVATREIFVPPAKRVLHVEVAPAAEAYLPGQAAKVLLKLTDENGEPYVGSLALSIYDKAVEYISGGSNVANIKAFFWKWRRQHRPQTETNLQRTSTLHVEREKPSMQDLGVFGRHALAFSFASRFAGAGGNRILGVRGAEASVSSLQSAEVADGVAGPLGDQVANEEADASQLANDSEPLVQTQVRENFADTALWIGALQTNAEGIAEVQLDMPENLTTWKVRVWGMGHGTRVGEGSAEVVTRKNLIVRLQAPRFFVETDEVVLSANVHNYLDEAKQVRVQLALQGETLTTAQQLERTVEIAAGGEQRVDWRVKAVREGPAIVRMSALTDEESDSMQQTFPVHVHGILKTESLTGVIKADQSSDQFTIDVPADRRAEQTRLEVRYTPTLAGAMVDALPYLIEYPHGCTEQTLNRFLPAVLTQQTLRKMNVDLASIAKKQTNLNAQEIGDDQERAADWKRMKKNQYEFTPVFDDVELALVVKAGVNRLTDMQLSDGGWGWFSGWGERSAPHTTAVVLRGLLIAKQNDVAIVPAVIERGTRWLADYQSKQIRLLQNGDNREQLDDDVPRKSYADNLDALVYMTLVEAGRDNTQDINKMRDYLFRDRTKLAVYSLATYGIALNKVGDSEKLSMVMRNLSQYVRQDDQNQTAWLELPNSGWWHWYGSEYEAHAYYLKLLVATQTAKTQPDSNITSPDSDIASRMVKYLLNNRKHATYWNSTRDTALVVEAFADYLAATGEADPEVTIELLLDGQLVKEVTITRESLFTFDNTLVIAGEALSSGRHTVEIRKQGKAPIYFNSYLTNFTLEDDIRAAGLELKVERQYFKLTPAEKSTDVAGGRGQVVSQRVEKYDRQPLVNLAEVTSGDLIEVELTVDSKNDYEYLLLEDLKAAGFEPVEVRSGYNGNEMNAYVEFRDDRVNLFVARLARGRHSLSYRLRAEIPGQFSALPTQASAMYAPELKANSDELKLRITDQSLSAE